MPAKPQEASIKTSNGGRFELRKDHPACEDCVNIYGTHAELRCKHAFGADPSARKQARMRRPAGRVQWL